MADEAPAVLVPPLGGTFATRLVGADTDVLHALVQVGMRTKVAAACTVQGPVNFRLALFKELRRFLAFL